MVREFKKVGAAAAVAGALLASGSSFATVQLSEPGDVLLVPHVVCDPAADEGQVNTLVGLITFDKSRIGLYANDVYYPAPWSLASFTVGGYVPPTPGAASLPIRRTTKPTVYTKTIHWWFYNTSSRHQLNGVIPATDNDFVRFDWCSTIRATGKTELNGVPGYLLFSSDEVDRDLVVPSFALYGHAYMIQGDWASQAFIPVLPNPLLSLDADGNALVRNVAKRSDGYPAITRLVSGSDFTHVNLADDRDLTPLKRDVYMRYFLDPTLATVNRMVFWFNWGENTGCNTPACLGYTNTVSISRGVSAAGETYDSEQVYKNSFSVGIPIELNILLSTPTDPAFPGMIHSEEEAYSGKTVVNTGIVRFGIPEAVAIYDADPGAGTDLRNSNVPFVSSGVSFNMLGLGAGGNAAQLQTEMSTQGPAY
jgi:hypothetical protein